MKHLLRIAAVISICLVATSPARAASQPSFMYGAWMPFWKKQDGAMEVALHLDKFQEVSPFSYEVKSDGSLVDKLKINEGLWPMWLLAAHDLKVKIVPTIAILDGDTIHALLSKTSLRKTHTQNIVNLVKAKKFDGIDIDYEDKNAETRSYFSTFIKELSGKLHAIKKTLSCTIEARTPAASRFAVIPPKLEYANDYAVLGRYCDEIKVMAYDQGKIDLTLDNDKGSSDLYMPVADPDWVSKVLKETVKTVNRSKIVLGIPSYGYVYEISWQDGVTTYKRLRSVTYPQAMALAASVGATPMRNSAGELSFTYATATSVSVSSGLTYSVSSTEPPVLASAPSSSVMRVVWFSDATSMSEKIRLAKQFKLRGAAFFKMDGDNDPKLWDSF